MALKIELQEKRNLIKKKLDKKLYGITHAAFVRSRSKLIEGEKSTSYFLNLEKTRQNNNRITKLIDINSKKQYNSEKDILKHCASFYSKLYASNNRIILMNIWPNFSIYLFYQIKIS